MKKLLVLLVTLMAVFTLSACSDNGEIDIAALEELENRITELEEAALEANLNLENVQNDLDATDEELLAAQALLDEALANLEEAQQVAIDLQTELDRYTCDDPRETNVDGECMIIVNQELLTKVVEVKDELEAEMAVEEPSALNPSSLGGTGDFGAIMYSEPLNFDNEVDLFGGDIEDEWIDMQIRYYNMLEEVILNGYTQGEYENIKDFVDDPSVYALDGDQEFELVIDFVNLNLYSRVFTYNDLEFTDLSKVQTINARVIDGNISLEFTRQYFENNLETSSYTEIFDTSKGLLQVGYPLTSSGNSLPYVRGMFGVEIRSDLVIYSTLYSQFGIFESPLYIYSYVNNGEIYLEYTNVGAENYCEASYQKYEIFYAIENPNRLDMITTINSYVSSILDRGYDEYISLEEIPFFIPDIEGIQALYDLKTSIETFQYNPEAGLLDAELMALLNNDYHTLVVDGVIDTESPYYQKTMQGLYERSVFYSELYSYNRFLEIEDKTLDDYLEYFRHGNIYYDIDLMELGYFEKGMVLMPKIDLHDYYYDENGDLDTSLFVDRYLGDGPEIPRDQVLLDYQTVMAVDPGTRVETLFGFDFINSTYEEAKAYFAYQNQFYELPTE